MQLQNVFPLSSPRLTGREPLVFLPGPFSNEPPTGKAHLKQCEQMTLTRRQKRLCRREPGLAETLRESVRLSLLECRYQFRNERWNCSLDGRGSLLKRGRSTIQPVTFSVSYFSPFHSVGCLVLTREHAVTHSFLSWSLTWDRCTAYNSVMRSLFGIKASDEIKSLWARHQNGMMNNMNLILKPSDYLQREEWKETFVCWICASLVWRQ